MNEIEKEIQSLERKSSSKEEIAKLNDSVSQQTKQLLEIQRRPRPQAGRADDQDGAARGPARGHKPSSLAALAADRGDAGRSRPAARRGRELRGAAHLARSPASRRLPASPRCPTPPSSLRAARPGRARRISTTPPTATTPRAAMPWRSRASRSTSIPIRARPCRTTPSTGSASPTTRRRKFKESIDDFDKLLKNWPKSGKAPAALLKKGYAQLELGQKAEAVVQLQYVVNEHPASEEARLARAKLKSLGIETR